jgi:hypothetical protein
MTDAIWASLISGGLVLATSLVTTWLNNRSVVEARTAEAKEREKERQHSGEMEAARRAEARQEAWRKRRLGAHRELLMALSVAGGSLAAVERATSDVVDGRATSQREIDDLLDKLEQDRRRVERAYFSVQLLASEEVVEAAENAVAAFREYCLLIFRAHGKLEAGAADGRDKLRPADMARASQERDVLRDAYRRAIRLDLGTQD